MRMPLANFHHGLQRQHIAELQQLSAYPKSIRSGATDVVLHETHISWIFLVGQFAYKIKKPIRNEFVDYSTLELRERFCHKELELDRRFAETLYLDVVPITVGDGKLRVEGDGTPIEYAVKMTRFSQACLLSERLRRTDVTAGEISKLAKVVANFHLAARRSDSDSTWATPKLIYEDAAANLASLEKSKLVCLSDLGVVGAWTDHQYEQLKPQMDSRRTAGFVRECHGDLHSENIIRLNGKWMPFDGVEFNERFHWIDVLSDVAFLGMDLSFRGRPDLHHTLINAYLEQTGDYRSLRLLRWYLVYRTMVRAKVAALRAIQTHSDLPTVETAINTCLAHVRLAKQLATPRRPSLMITCGVSGSGKTTRSEFFVRRDGSIRLRSDVERKRRRGMKPEQRPHSDAERQTMYRDTARARTYDDLRQLAERILTAGYSVIVDATFLQRRQRAVFQELARTKACEFQILTCDVNDATLQERLAARGASGQDASDADLSVLKQQLKQLEPLSESEQAFAVDPLLGSQHE